MHAKYQLIFHLQNPYKLWVDWDIETKRLIPGVVLGGRIYYNKKTGITTPWIPQYYAVISSFSKSNSLKLEVEGIEPSSKSHAAILTTIIDE